MKQNDQIAILFFSLMVMVMLFSLGRAIGFSEGFGQSHPDVVAQLNLQSSTIDIMALTRLKP